jgi:hypothetical protein
VSNVAFLLIVVVIAIVGSLAVWLRNRKPTTFMSSVEEFQQEMKALGREPGQSGGGSRRSKGRTNGGRGAPPRGPGTPSRGSVEGGPADEPPAGT